jgi:hypothetical protein
MEKHAMQLALLWLAILAGLGGFAAVRVLESRQLTPADLTQMESQYYQDQLQNVTDLLAQGVWPQPKPEPFVAPTPSWQVAHPVLAGGIVGLAIFLVGSLILLPVRLVQFMRRMETERTPGVTMLS